MVLVAVLPAESVAVNETGHGATELSVNEVMPKEPLNDEV